MAEGYGTGYPAGILNVERARRLLERASDPHVREVGDALLKRLNLLMLDNEALLGALTAYQKQPDADLVVLAQARTIVECKRLLSAIADRTTPWTPDVAWNDAARKAIARFP